MGTAPGAGAARDGPTGPWGLTAIGMRRLTRFVRVTTISLIVGLWICGCASSPSGGPDRGAVRLDRRVTGQVVSVNVPLRFVVMDFPVWRMPAMDQRLGVYREGQKIGEIKVTGPVVDTAVAGDLLAGEAREGDEVRE